MDVNKKLAASVLFIPKDIVFFIKSLIYEEHKIEKRTYPAILSCSYGVCEFCIKINSPVAKDVSISVGIEVDKRSKCIVDRGFGGIYPNSDKIKNKYLCGWIYSLMLLTIFETEKIDEYEISHTVLHKLGFSGKNDLNFNKKEIEEEMEDNEKICGYDGISMKKVKSKAIEKNNGRGVEIEYRIRFE